MSTRLASQRSKGSGARPGRVGRCLLHARAVSAQVVGGHEHRQQAVEGDVVVEERREVSVDPRPDLDADRVHVTGHLGPGPSRAAPGARPRSSPMPAPTGRGARRRPAAAPAPRPGPRGRHARRRPPGRRRAGPGWPPNPGQVTLRPGPAGGDRRAPRSGTARRSCCAARPRWGSRAATHPRHRARPTGARRCRGCARTGAQPPGGVPGPRGRSTLTGSCRRGPSSRGSSMSMRS